MTETKLKHCVTLECWSKISLHLLRKHCWKLLWWFWKNLNECYKKKKLLCARRGFFEIQQISKNDYKMGSRIKHETCLTIQNNQFLCSNKSIAIIVKNQNLEIIKAVHDGTGQCTHTKTMAFHKEIQFIQKFHSGSVLLLGKL